VRAAPDLRLDEAAGRWVLLATVLGSGVAMLDATVVNVALPAISRDLGGGLGGFQWVVSGYTLTVASFILLGGSLGRPVRTSARVPALASLSASRRDA